MDPQHRLLLETAWEALEHAGLSADRLAGSTTGVFVGLCGGDYGQLMMERGERAIDAYLASGTAHSIAAGRVSYALGLHGPSISIDTACSSSLVALHYACQSLRLGECSAALAGGVNLMLAPEVTIALSQGAHDGAGRALQDVRRARRRLRARRGLRHRRAEAAQRRTCRWRPHPRSGARHRHRAGRPQQRPDRAERRRSGSGDPRRARERRPRTRAGLVRRGARHWHLARRPDRGAGARGRARRGTRPSAPAAAGLRESKHRAPRSRGRRCRVHQGGAGAAAPLDTRASAARQAQPAYRMGAAAGVDPDRDDRVARRKRTAPRRRQLLRLQRHQCAPHPRRSGGGRARAASLPPLPWRACHSSCRSVRRRRPR